MCLAWPSRQSWGGRPARGGREKDTPPLLPGAVVSGGWREGRPAVPRPAFWRRLPGGGGPASGQGGKFCPLAGVVRVCPLPRSLLVSRARVSLQGGAFNHQSARCPAPAKPAAPAAGRHPGTCCHLRSAGLSAAKPPSPDPRQAPAAPAGVGAPTLDPAPTPQARALRARSGLPRPPQAGGARLRASRRMGAAPAAHTPGAWVN